MSSKKKSHGVLFTPYLEKGEDLIWVGMPEKNSFLIKTYYAFTTKRFLILQRSLWKNLLFDTHSLMLLPEHRLQSNDDGTSTICFIPRQIEMSFPKRRLFNGDGWYDYDGKETFVEAQRPNLEHLSQEDAETANELLTAVKNDMLDKRARELGLMD